MTRSQKALLLLSYAAGALAVFGWVTDSEPILLGGGWTCASLTVLFIIGGGLHPLTPVLAVGLGAWLIGGLQGALVGNALSVVALEWVSVLKVFSTETISAAEARHRAEVERALR